MLISRPLCKKEALLCVPHLQIRNEWHLIEMGLTQSPICLSNLKEVWRFCLHRQHPPNTIILGIKMGGIEEA